MMNKRELLEERSQDVVKANELIQKKRYSLTLNEQKMLLYLISKIKPSDEYNTAYTLNIDNFIEVCGLDASNGGNYHHTKQTIIKLLSKPIVYKEGKWDVITNWFGYAKLDEEGNSFTIKFSEALAPYLFRLNTNYTKYPLENALPMKSNYGVRLYELCRSVAYRQKAQIFSLEELKGILDCAEYPVYKDFRVRVLEPAVKDINTYTDLDVSFAAKRTGHRVTHIEFTIETSQHQAKRHLNRHYALNKSRTYKMAGKAPISDNAP